MIRRLPVAMKALLCTLFLCVMQQASVCQISGNTVDWGVQPMSISRVGAAGWQFLKLPTDARSAALGGIKSAVSYGNANSALNNPASAVDVSGMDIQFTSMKWVADIQYNSLSFVKNLGVWGTVGINCIFVNYGEMIRTKVGEGFDANNNSLGIVPLFDGSLFPEGATFTAHDLAVGVLYSRQITENLQVGGTLRYMDQRIDDATMRSWALDIGTLYWTGLGSLRISMLGKNFGPDGQFLDYRNRVAQAPANVKMPMMFIFGAAYDLFGSGKTSGHRMTIAAEYVKPNDGPDKIHVGLEYFAFSNIYLRGGYRFYYDEESYTLGFGCEYSIEDALSLKLDYGYANVGRFKSVNMFTVGFGL